MLTKIRLATYLKMHSTDSRVTTEQLEDIKSVSVDNGSIVLGITSGSDMTTSDVVKAIESYPDDMRIVLSDGSDVKHLGCSSFAAIIGRNSPIGICNRTGGNVYPSAVEGYVGYSLELDEDLCSFEFEAA